MGRADGQSGSLDAHFFRFDGVIELEGPVKACLTVSGDVKGDRPGEGYRECGGFGSRGAEPLPGGGLEAAGHWDAGARPQCGG